MKAAGVCLIRDAADMVPFLCGHYLRLGFDRLLFIDDNSADGTFALLKQIAQLNEAIEVETVATASVQQPEKVSRAANTLIGRGYEIIFPFDSDEFWDIDLEAIRAEAKSAKYGLFLGQWVQFVQDGRQRRSTLFGPLRARNRAPVLPVSPDNIPDLSKQPFVCATFPKVAFVSANPVSVGLGQHFLVDGPQNIVMRDLELFHLPVRSAAEIVARAQNAGRWLADAKPGQGWHTAQIRDLVAAGKADQVWKMNSADSNGQIDLGGDKIALIPDTRLRRLLFRALLFLTLRHPSFMVKAVSKSRRREPSAG